MKSKAFQDTEKFKEFFHCFRKLKGKKMKLEIKNKKDNTLLKRSEVVGIVKFDQTTPNNDEIKKAIAQAIKCDEKLVAIKHIYTGFGKREASVEAYCYQDEAALKLLENIKEKKEAAQPAPAQ